MKLNKHINIIIILIVIFTYQVLNASEIKRSTLKTNSDAVLYEFLVLNNSKKDISKIKQLSVKAKSLKIDIKGSDRNEIKIITLKKYISIDNNKFEKIIKFSDESSLHKEGFDDFANFDISVNDKEILLDFPKLLNDETQTVELFLPKNISLDLKIKEGNIKISKFNSEINIKGKQLNTEFKDISSVIEVENKVGSFTMNNFEGVLNLNNLSGNMIFNEINGSLNIKSSTGSFDMKKFSGNLELTTKVSDIKIIDSKESEIFIDYKSGDLELENLKKIEIVDITATIGDISVENSNIKKLNIVNQGGDISLRNSKARMNIDLKAGDIIYESEELFLGDDSYLAIEYGDIIIDIEDTKKYDYYNNIDIKPIDFNAIKDLKNIRNLRVGLRGGESNYMNLAVSSGSVIIK